ncbi:MlaD family protein [Nocardia sp. XZ_19_385]|uniref:MlaD family protein n=1 Tax=Nocardia sp. XZ_19_385 TaxID=2769488 RepID=UPI0018903271|nr:MlaD family protein [Nocardia sp. XZ_19_385]
MTVSRNRSQVLAVALAGALALGGCAFDPSEVPIPGTTVSGDTYQVHIQFADALNLPPGAKVTANGVLVGNLDEIEIITPEMDRSGPPTGYVRATVRISSSARLPTATTAQLRQATPLGDVHIALTTPVAATGATLTDGATIPIAATKPSPQVEDTMAGLATAVGGGTITNFQDIVRQLNRVFDENPAETARVFGVIGTDIIDVAGRLDSVDSLLEGLQATVGFVQADRDILDRLLTDYGVEHVTANVNSAVQLVYVFSDLGPVSRSAAWLGPLVGALDATTTALVPALFGARPLDLNSPANLRKLMDLIQTKLIPFAQHGPKVDITAVTVGDAPGDQTAKMLEALRMIGAVR